MATTPRPEDKIVMLIAKDVVRELQEMRDQGFLSDALLRRAVRLIRSGDDRYDWVGGFLLREGGNTLWLHNYVGTSSEQAEIPVGGGVGGASVAARENLIVADVATIDGYVSPAPDSRSELFVLIRAGSDIFGGIGVSSEEASRFAEKDLVEIQQVADKLAEQIAAERR